MKVSVNQYPGWFKESGIRTGTVADTNSRIVHSIFQSSKQGLIRHGNSRYSSRASAIKAINNSVTADAQHIKLLFSKCVE